MDCVSAKLSVPQMAAQHAKPNDSSKKPYCQYEIMRSIQIIFESKRGIWASIFQCQETCRRFFPKSILLWFGKAVCGRG